jgi:hypothetical protein
MLKTSARFSHGQWQWKKLSPQTIYKKGAGLTKITALFVMGRWRLVSIWHCFPLRQISLVTHPGLGHFDENLITPSEEPSKMIQWWEESQDRIQKSERRRFNGVVIYTIWNIWKERNRRIFNGVFEMAVQVASRVKEDIEQQQRALTWDV